MAGSTKNKIRRGMLALCAVAAVILTALVLAGCGDPLDPNAGNNEFAAYTLTTAAFPEGGGIVKRDPDREKYQNGMTVTLTAEPSDNHEFEGWSDESKSESTVLIVTITGNITINANFRPIRHTLEVYSNPAAGGTVKRDPDSTSYALGTKVTVVAAPNNGYAFIGWSGVSTSEKDTISVTMDNNMTLTANFVPVNTVCTLRVEQNIADGNIVTPDGAELHNAGARLSITATPLEARYRFINWTADPPGAVTFLDSTARTTGITVNTNATVTANFMRTFALSMGINYDGREPNSGNGGTITPPARSSARYDSGTVVRISAIAESGNTFTYWTVGLGGSASGNGSHIIDTLYSADTTVTLTGNLFLWAGFTKDGALYDIRNSQSYKTVKIDSLWWMAENLNHTTSNSWCYDNENSNCDTYGRLYTWDAAMTACPTGWRLPTRQDWNNLTQAAGGVLMAGNNLKTTFGWNDKANATSGNGTDELGFSALPGGYRRWPDSFFNCRGSDGHWWSATNDNVNGPWSLFLHSESNFIDEINGDRLTGLSVRCVQN